MIKLTHLYVILEQIKLMDLLGRVFEVPKLSKRLLAEVIDFGLLFFIKAFVTLTVLDAWNTE